MILENGTHHLIAITLFVWSDVQNFSPIKKLFFGFLDGKLDQDASQKDQYALETFCFFDQRESLVPVLRGNHYQNWPFDWKPSSTPQVLEAKLVRRLQKDSRQEKEKEWGQETSAWGVPK